MKIKSQKILVLGGSGQLGQAIVGELTKNSIHTTATYHRQETPLPLEAGEWVKWKIGDKLSPDLEKFGPWDGVASCLGGTPGSELEGSLDKLLDFLNDLQSKKMLNQNANIVLLSSFINQKMVDTDLDFAILQGGLRTATRVLAKKIGRHNILVNSVELGIFEAENSKRLSESDKRMYLENCSLSRFGKWPEAVFIFNWFLLYNTYITGQNVLVDGGL